MGGKAYKWLRRELVTSMISEEMGILSLFDHIHIGGDGDLLLKAKSMVEECFSPIVCVRVTPCKSTLFTSNNRAS